MDPTHTRRISLAQALMAGLVFIAGAGGAQAAPDRIELTIAKDGSGDLQIDWQDACSKAGTDYAIYEGNLGTFNSHSANQCSTTGTTALVAPLPGSAYYLVVPLEDGSEGSYGVDSAGTERAVGTSTCLAGQVLSPCLSDSFVDAEPARLARLDTVLDDASAMLLGGSTYTQIAAMLALEPDVEDVFSDGVTLFFVVDGLPTALHDGDAARHGGPLHDIIPPANPLPPAPGGGNLASDPVTADATQPLLPLGQRMVGKDDDGDGFRDRPKHALILAPWEFDFSTNDSAPLAQALLNGIWDYQQGSVTYRSNQQDLTLMSMTLSDYTDGWDDKDIIFISTHGGQNNNSRFGPDPYIYLGIGGSTCEIAAARLKAEVPVEAQRPGLHCSRVKHGTGILADTIATTAFWDAVHGGSLDKKVIYFDGCRTAATPALAQSITGPDSIFLGWSQNVYTTTSIASMDAVLRETTEDAFPVLRSFVRECGGGVCMDPPAAGRVAAELLAAWDRSDLRTREGLNITSTPMYGLCGESPTLPVSQTCPSCGGGIAMSMSFNITVEGLEPEDVAFLQDPFEFAKYQLRLFADVDDVESGYAMVLADPYIVPLGNGEYADAFGITLYMDNICPNQIIEYKPWVLLPAFDEAMPGNDARDRMYSWDAPYTIEIVPVQFP